jgi:hypothetical protein
MKHTLRLLTAFALFGCIGYSDSLSAPSLIFSNPLPTANVNNSTQADRSNWSYTEFPSGDPLQFLNFDGDDFVLNAQANNAYIVQSISTWSVASIMGQALGDEFSSVSLYVRAMNVDPITGAQSPAGPFQLIATGAPNTSFNSDGVTVGNSNPNITDTQVTYSNGQTYMDNQGNQYPLWETTFNNLDLTLQGGVVYQFAVWGLGYYNNNTPCTTDLMCMDPSDDYGYWFNEYSNPAKAGVTNPYANAPLTSGDYLKFDCDANNPPSPSACTALDAASAPLEGTRYNGTTVPVNENVLIYGTGIPEPATFALVGTGLVALGLFARRNRKRG